MNEQRRISENNHMNEGEMENDQSLHSNSNPREASQEPSNSNTS